MYVKRAFIKGSVAQAGMTVDSLKHGHYDFTKKAAQFVSGCLKKNTESKI